MNFRSDLPNYTAFISHQGNFRGCGVMYKHGVDDYVITAGHNCYGSNFLDKCVLGDLSVRTEFNGNYNVVDIIGKACDIKDFDLVLLKVIPVFPNNVTTNLPTPLLKRANHLDDAYVKRVTNKAEEEPWNVHPMRYESAANIDGSLFYVDVDDKYLYNKKNGKFGPDALGGISGSGVFIETSLSSDQRVLVGIVIEVRANTMANRVKCSCVRNLMKLLPDLQVFENLPDNEVAPVDAINQLLEEAADFQTESAINDWIEQNRDSEPIKNLIRKTSLVYPEERQMKERVRIIKAFLSGKVVFDQKIHKQDILKALYEMVLEGFGGRSDLYHYTTGPADAKQHWDFLSRVLMELLTDSYSLTLSKLDIQILSNYTFSEFVTNCTIDLKQST